MIKVLTLIVLLCGTAIAADPLPAKMDPAKAARLQVYFNELKVLNDRIAALSQKILAIQKEYRLQDGDTFDYETGEIIRKKAKP